MTEGLLLVGSLVALAIGWTALDYERIRARLRARRRGGFIL